MSTFASIKVHTYLQNKPDTGYVEIEFYSHTKYEYILQMAERIR